MEFGSYDGRAPRKTRESSPSPEPGKALVQRILDTLPDERLRQLAYFRSRGSAAIASADGYEGNQHE